MANLTRKQIEEFRTRLRKRQDILRQVIDEEIVHEEREDYKQILGRVRDSGEDAVTDVIADLNIATLNRELEEFKDIDAAINRIREVTFGLCADCDADIELARLEAYPTAKRCLRCQRHHEATYANKTTPSL